MIGQSAKYAIKPMVDDCVSLTFGQENSLESRPVFC